MKIYDLTFIFNPNNTFILEDFISFFKNLIIYNNYIILNTEIWGILRLRYKIKNEKKGFFFFIRMYINVYFLKKIFNILKNNNFILRYLLICLKKNSSLVSCFCLKKLIKKNVSKRKIVKKKF